MSKPVIEPCNFGAISRNMAPDGAEILYEIRVFEARGHYEDPKVLSSWQSYKIHCFAVRCKSESTAKRCASRVAKQFDRLDTITLWVRGKKHSVDERYLMYEVFRREKLPMSKSWHPWQEVDPLLCDTAEVS